MTVKKGFTLVELVISLVIIGVILYAALSIFVTSGVRGTNVEIFTVAQTLAESKLEELIARDFDDVTSETLAYFTDELNDYSYVVSVYYVSPEALDLAVAGPTGYKKAVIAIDHSKLDTPTTLEVIRSDY